MTHILKNHNLEIHLDHPTENYNFSRFDWTGKIVAVKFHGTPVTIKESLDGQNEHVLGKAFYNEFGIDTALGFEEAEIGEWFHKIGVGLLKKEDNQYLFSKKYEIKPASFKVRSAPNRLFISCQSESVRGYSYRLEKEISLQENGFRINYLLQNTGAKEIVTDEYVHNFTSINNIPIGVNYVLKFPFQLRPERFAATVNPEQKVNVGSTDIKFNGSPSEPFFFSHLSGNEQVDAHWELIHLENGIGLSEIGSFQTSKVNLWGTSHVISPELFFHISIKPGESVEWSRQYDLHNAK